MVTNGLCEFFGSGLPQLPLAENLTLAFE